MGMLGMEMEMESQDLIDQDTWGIEQTGVWSEVGNKLQSSRYRVVRTGSLDLHKFRGGPFPIARLI
jgi:hypothetical protein